MKIREIRAAGLKGATPQGGWSSELVPEDCVHTLVVVFTDEGVTGVGSVFTNSDLVMLQDYEVSWFEEPLKPDAIDDYVLLRCDAPVPIAGGEVLTCRQSFDAWLKKGVSTSYSLMSPRWAESASHGALPGWLRKMVSDISHTAGILP